MAQWSATETPDAILDSAGLRSEFKNEKYELRESLDRCCRDRVNAGITLTDTNTLCRARFSELVDHTLTLELEDEELTSLPPLSTCMVSYFHAGKAHLFLSMVRDFHPETGGGRIFLRLPEQLAVSQVRWSFRVPMEGISEFSVRLRDQHGRLHSPACRDISFGGMRVEFSEFENPELERGDACDLILGYLGKEIRMRAEVRHRHGLSYGLHLPQAFEDGRFNPPDLYRWIVAALEQRCYGY